MARIPFCTRPIWTRSTDNHFDVHGEAVRLPDGEVIARSVPIRVTAEVLEDAEKLGPGVDRLVEGIEQTVQGMAREAALAKM